MLKSSSLSVAHLLIGLLVVPFGLQAQTTIRFAAVGDNGAGVNTQTVAGMIAGWSPDFVITVGDNNYTSNDTTTARWDAEVGQAYHQFIRYPAGSTSMYAPGSTVNRFFPALGNHDWDAGISGWYQYFDLPGNERYFDFVRGPVHFFVIDSDPREPDGNTATSNQATWIRSQLAASTSRWNVVSSIILHIRQPLAGTMPRCSGHFVRGECQLSLQATSTTTNGSRRTVSRTL
ncbi:MAG: metallophosphoesterase [Bacteroidota bacterium]